MSGSSNQGSGAAKAAVVEVDGVDADDVAGLLEEVAKQIRNSAQGGKPLDLSASFRRVNSAQLFDLVHRS
jgi:hypothetical protein